MAVTAYQNEQVRARDRGRAAGPATLELFQTFSLV